MDVADRSLRRMRNAAMFAAFNTWRQQAADAREQARKMKGALTRMINRKLSAAFEKWQAEAAQAKAEGDALKHALMKMIHSKLAAGFSTWRQTAADAKQQENGGYVAGHRVCLLSQRHDGC